LSVAQRWAAQSLRIARDNLSDTVQKLKKSNEALSRSEAYLAEAQTLSHTGSAGWNVSTGELFWSDESFRIFGYERSFKPTMERALQRVHPEDLARVQQALEAASHGQKLDIENRLVMPDGSVKTVHVQGHPQNQEATGVLEVVGAITDITTVKNAFEEIRTLRDQLYKENVALREEIDITRMFEEIVGSSLASGEGGADGLNRSDHRRNRYGKRAYSTCNSQALAAVFERVCKCQLRCHPTRSDCLGAFRS